jgi:glycerol uptake facilitator-like aquaporin
MESFGHCAPFDRGSPRHGALGRARHRLWHHSGEACRREQRARLLCNTLATGAILVVIITIFAPVSGAHFNPVVSLVMMIRGELDRREALAYIPVQIVGGCLGAPSPI